MLEFSTKVLNFISAKKADIDERGATAVEYALMVGLIALAIIAGATALGGAINTKFTNAGTTVAH